MSNEGILLDDVVKKHVTSFRAREGIRTALSKRDLSSTERTMLIAMHHLLDQQQVLTERYDLLEAKASQCLKLLAEEHVARTGVFTR